MASSLTIGFTGCCGENKIGLVASGVLGIVEANVSVSSMAEVDSVDAIFIELELNVTGELDTIEASWKGPSWMSASSRSPAEGRSVSYINPNTSNIWRWRLHV